jgi:MYXO-CTERM domain-containing protein
MICVEPCNSDSDCSDEFDCRSVGGTKVCALPEDGGCCSTTSAPPKLGNIALTFLTLFGVIFVARRRRLHG